MIGTISLVLTTIAERGNADSMQLEQFAESAGGKPFLFNRVRQAGFSARVE